MTRRALTILALGLTTVASAVRADEVRTRIVVWNGTSFAPLCNDTIHATAGGLYRIRLQVGVFDTPGSPAAAGGMVGWRDGSVATTGGVNTRTPGCLAPFFMTFAPGGSCDCRVVAEICPDPFGVLNAMNAYTNTRSPVWSCAGGAVPPAPLPGIYGRNEYRDIFEMTTVAGPGTYEVTLAGDLYVADEWRLLPGSVPPDCGVPGDPDDDVVGTITYAPVVRPPIPFVRSVTVTTAPPVDCLGDRIPDECQLAFTERLYSLTGTSAGTPWSWCVNSARFPSVCNTMVPGVPAGQPALSVADAFAASINAAACPDSQLFAQAYSLFGTTYLVVSVASEVTGDTPFDLCVGPGGGPAACCPVMAFSSCAFNPTLTRIPTSGADCNGNGHDDTIDILTGRSADANQDGIPDDCQGPPCRADFNNDNTVNSQDFFDFLAAFFANQPSADFNRDQAVNSQDFFDFVAAFFAGC